MDPKDVEMDEFFATLKRLEELNEKDNERVLKLVRCLEEKDLRIEDLKAKRGDWMKLAMDRLDQIIELKAEVERLKANAEAKTRLESEDFHAYFEQRIRELERKNEHLENVRRQMKTENQSMRRELAKTVKMPIFTIESGEGLTITGLKLTIPEAE